MGRDYFNIKDDYEIIDGANIFVTAYKYVISLTIKIEK